jgi:hypothetical protein
MQQPIDERFRIVFVTQTEESVHGKRRIAQPGETIIPI